MKNIKSLVSLLTLALFMASCAKEDLSKNLNDAATPDQIQANEDITLLDEAGLIKALGINEAVDSRTAPQSVVYTLSNEVSGNEVIAFNRNADGTIYEAGRYSTGGTGTGGGLGNQGALVLSENGKFLFVVNPGSNDISYLYVNKDGSLELKGKIASGGEMPVSIDQRLGRIYVLNAGGTGNVVGFGFNQQGNIMQLPNAAKPLSSSAAGAAQVAISPNGRALVITEKATNAITAYPILHNGALGNRTTINSAGATPFGFEFGSFNTFFVSEAAGGMPGASTISSYRVENHGAISLVDGPFALNETAACWVVLTNNNQTLFATNTGSNTISSIHVSGLGNLSMANGGNTTPSMSAPIDAAVDKTSNNLYVLATGNNAIISYTIGNNGQLTQIDLDDDNLPDRMTGLVVK